MATTEQPPPATVLAEHGLSVEQLYDELTDGCAKPLRLDDLLFAAAERSEARARVGDRVASHRSGETNGHRALISRTRAGDRGFEG